MTRNPPANALSRTKSTTTSRCEFTATYGRFCLCNIIRNRMQTSADTLSVTPTLDPNQSRLLQLWFLDMHVHPLHVC